MENLTDKNIRSELIARYLEAETDVREEMLLAEYFAEHAPEADEAAVARLVLAERPEALLAAGERAFAPHPSTAGRRMLAERPHPSTAGRRMPAEGSHPSTAGRRMLAERPHPSTAGRRVQAERSHPSTTGRRIRGSARQKGAARGGRRLLWSCVAAAAAALALFLLLRPAAQEAPAFTPLEVAEGLNAIANLGLGDIESVTAVPSGANFLVTVHLKDGNDLPFIMSKDGDTGALSLASTE